MICWFYIEFWRVCCPSTFQRTPNEVIRWWAAAVAQFISTRRPKQTIKCRIFSRFYSEVENQSSYSTRWQWILHRRLVTKNRCQVTSCLINLDTRGSLIGRAATLNVRPDVSFYWFIQSCLRTFLLSSTSIWKCEHFFALQTGANFRSSTGSEFNWHIVLPTAVAMRCWHTTWLYF
jgi:hypothetical protein